MLDSGVGEADTDAVTAAVVDNSGLPRVPNSVPAQLQSAAQQVWGHTRRAHHASSAGVHSTCGEDTETRSTYSLLGSWRRMFGKCYDCRTGLRLGRAWGMLCE